MDRDQLEAELIEELVAHSPAHVMRTMRRWPGGPLSLIHVHVLLVLEADGPVPMRVLAEGLDVSQASATGIVDRMEQRGLVERHRDDEDRRVVRVALTEEGRTMIGTLAADRREKIALLLHDLTDEELQGFLLGARAMRRSRERYHAAHADAAHGEGAHGEDAPR